MIYVCVHKDMAMGFCHDVSQPKDAKLFHYAIFALCLCHAYSSIAHTRTLLLLSKSQTHTHT